jgi:NAD(P)H-dependent FMN reductase
MEPILAREKKSGPHDKKLTTNSPGRTGGAEALQQTFNHLSQVLTAENFLPADLVDAYFKRIQDNLGSQLAALLARFEVLVKSGRNPPSQWTPSV